MADDVQRISGTSAKVAARLCNFATGESFLLRKHQDFLDTDVARVIRTMQGPWVDLFGYASRAGNAQFNQALSSKRLEAVKWRIAQYANNVKFQIQTALGETESGPNERNNDGYWRAVEVYVYGSRPPPPKPDVTTKVRRIVFRSFSKSEPTPDLPGGAPDFEKDAINELLKLGTRAAKGKLTAEGLLGSEDGRRVSEVPFGHRVVKVVIDTDRTYDTFVGGSLLQESTSITYQWGAETPSVVVEHRFQFTMNKRPFPPQNKIQHLPRRQAEAIPLIVPPDP